MRVAAPDIRYLDMGPKGVVVFAAGRLSTDVPGLAYVGNRPIAHHVLDALLASGVEEVIVTGAADVLIDARAALGDYSPQPRLRYAVSADSGDMIGALEAVTPLVGPDSCVMHPADGLLSEPLAPYLNTLRQSAADVLLVCQETPSPPDTAIAIFAAGALAHAGLANGKLHPHNVEALANQLTTSGRFVQSCAAQRWRRYAGHPSELLELNQIALDQLTPQPLPDAGHNNRIEGRVQIDPSALIDSSVIVGPAIVGPAAEISAAYIGPYTSIGARARIEGAEIERSIISPDVTIMHTGDRLSSCLIGAHARIVREFSLPRALRLRVSAGDEVVFC